MLHACRKTCLRVVQIGQSVCTAALGDQVSPGLPQSLVLPPGSPSPSAPPLPPRAARERGGAAGRGGEGGGGGGAAGAGGLPVAGDGGRRPGGRPSGFGRLCRHRCALRPLRPLRLVVRAPSFQVPAASHFTVCLQPFRSHFPEKQLYCCRGWAPCQPSARSIWARCQSTRHYCDREGTQNHRVARRHVPSCDATPPGVQQSSGASAEKGGSTCVVRAASAQIG